MGEEQEPARRMVVAMKPEMSEIGYEDVVVSGFDSIRRRSERGTGRSGRQRVPLSVGSEESDLASAVSGEFLSIFSALFLRVRTHN